ncbi:uncharacterized protein [Eurosta solidaginis]|uniref:uncharacterized protein n=1 Tax=Eurosta solidaginis TaxID=178769 RepID=UPI003530AEA3
MFFTRMVSGFIYSKNSNKNANNSSQQQQQQHSSAQQHTSIQQSAKSPKPHKKSDKCKRSLSKTDSKKSISELSKSTAAKDLTVERPCTSSHSNTWNYNSTNNNNNNTNNASKEAPCTSKSATHKPPTKVKSGSWKRSEKQITGYNSISTTGKKSKSLRKRSPTWLKFPNTPVMITEKVTYVSPVDCTSVCRPGTLYSDVLFGAGSSCLVKIKTLTPRRNANNAQKKLTKALLKCGGTENEAASGSDAETDRTELFPSLNGGGVSAATLSSSPLSMATATTTGTSPDDSPRKICNTPSPTTVSPISDSITTSDATTSAAINYAAFATNMNKASLSKYDVRPSNGLSLRCTDDVDVVTLSEPNCNGSSGGVAGINAAFINGFNDNSYGNYLEHHSKQINGTSDAPQPPLLSPKPQLVTNLVSATGNGICDDANVIRESGLHPDFVSVSRNFPHLTTKPSFTIDIPQWNFLEADVGADAYPKFLCQFDDEHYLKAEKMALLGLKLALGNGNSSLQQGKFKF